MKGIDLKRAVKSRPMADDWFTLQLLRLILKADSDNKKKLALGYPVEVQVCHIFKTDCPYLDDKKQNVDYDLIVKTAEEEVKGAEVKSKSAAEKV